MVYNVILMETIGMSVMFTVLSCYVCFDIKGIKIMASDVINYKYHIKICHCGKNMVSVVFFNYK